MRRIILAPSFDAELLAISSYVEDRFGMAAADAFEAEFRHVAILLAETPLIGKQDHGYPTNLFGFVLGPNWVFYRFSSDEIHLLHIRDSQRNKQDQSFPM